MADDDTADDSDTQSKRVNLPSTHGSKELERRVTYRWGRGWSTTSTPTGSRRVPSSVSVVAAVIMPVIVIVVVAVATTVIAEAVVVKIIVCKQPERTRLITTTTNESESGSGRHNHIDFVLAKFRVFSQRCHWRNCIKFQKATATGFCGEN